MPIASPVHRLQIGFAGFARPAAQLLFAFPPCPGIRISQNKNKNKAIFYVAH
jgi:hypothetical protein